MEEEEVPKKETMRRMKKGEKESAAAEGPQRRTEALMRIQQEVQIKESRWGESQQKVDAAKMRG